LEQLAGAKEAVRDLREDLRDSKQRAKTRPAIGAQASNIGKVVEKIAPSLPGFPVHAGDCWALFEPIDYVVFHGLAVRRTIEAVTFVDVKSGNGSLNNAQRQVKALVKAAKVSLTIISRAEEPK
jgi:predicted Holliday junction resolvase-like endonuclease